VKADQYLDTFHRRFGYTGEPDTLSDSETQESFLTKDEASVGNTGEEEEVENAGANMHELRIPPGHAINYPENSPALLMLHAYNEAKELPGTTHADAVKFAHGHGRNLKASRHHHQVFDTLVEKACVDELSIPPWDAINYPGTSPALLMLHAYKEAKELPGMTHADAMKFAHGYGRNLKASRRHHQIFDSIAEPYNGHKWQT